MPEFEHNGAGYRIVPTDEWTWEDALYAKRASDGMTVAQIERGVMELDPDACIAMMAVSIHRVRTTVAADKLRNEIAQGGGNMLGWFEQIAREEVGDTEGAVVPPDEGAEAPEREVTTP